MANVKYPIIAHNISFLRDFLNLRNEPFAVKFGVKRGAIESYTQGRVKPKVEFTQAICNYFGLQPEQLVNQKLTEADLTVSGSVRTITEVKLEEALKQIELLKSALADKEEIITLLKKK